MNIYMVNLAIDSTYVTDYNFYNYTPFKNLTDVKQIGYSTELTLSNTYGLVSTIYTSSPPTGNFTIYFYGNNGSSQEKYEFTLKVIQNNGIAKTNDCAA